MIETQKESFISAWNQIEDSNRAISESELETGYFLAPQEVINKNYQDEKRLSKQLRVLRKSYPEVGIDIERIMVFEAEMVGIYKDVKSGIQIEGVGERWQRAFSSIQDIKDSYVSGANSSLGIVFASGLVARRQLEAVRQAIKANNIMPQSK